MTKSYFPFDAGAGANVIEAQWALMARLFCQTGVVYGQLDQLEVFADNSGMNVKVRSGQAFIEGFFFQSDAQETLTIAPADSSNSRIDRVVVRLDRTANTIDLDVLTGTPDADPFSIVPVALTQNSTIWEIGLAFVGVGGGQTSIIADNIADERGFTTDILNIPGTVIKPSDEYVTSSTSLQDDDDLFFTAIAGARYLVELYLILYSNNAAPDFQWDISVPFGTYTIYDGVSPVALTASVAKPYYIRVEVFVAFGGTVKLQWAQNISSGDGVGVLQESFLRYTRLS